MDQGASDVTAHSATEELHCSVAEVDILKEVGYERRTI